jgi:hypothetical protein
MKSDSENMLKTRLHDYALQHAGELVAAGAQFGEIAIRWIDEWHVAVYLKGDLKFETIVCPSDDESVYYFYEKAQEQVTPIPGFEKWFKAIA